MPAKPNVVYAGANGEIPVVADQHPADQEWHMPAGIRDGHDETQGKKADTAVTDPALSATEIALLKGLLTVLKGNLAVNVNSFPALPAGGNIVGKVGIDPAANGASLAGNAVRQILVQPPALDYKGKTAAQTFDVPHVAKQTTRATFDAPSAITAEASQAAYGTLSAQDGNLYNSVTTTVAGQYAQHLFSFDLLNALKIAGYIPQSWDVATLIARTQSILVNWVGYGVGSNAGVSTNGATAKNWRPGDNTWQALGTNTASTPTSINAGASASSRVDANGFLHILAHSTYPSDGTIASTIYTDYISVSVQFMGDYLNNGNQLTQGKPGSPPPPMAQQIGGVKNGTLAVPAVATAADGMSASLDGLVTTAVMMGSNGASRDVMRVANVFKAASVAASTTATVWTPGANKKFRLMGFVMTVTTGAGPAGVTIRDGAAGTVLPVAVPAGSPLVVPAFGNGWASAAANNALQLVTDAGGTVRVIVWGVEE